MFDGEETSLKQLLQKMTDSGMTVILGKVIQETPLKIQAINDEKLIIGSNSIFLPRHMTDYITMCYIEDSGKHDQHVSGDGEHSHYAKIHIYNALKTGEVVHMLVFNNGKNYYILDRTI